jgi:rhodanese-related sulfurtransferase
MKNITGNLENIGIKIGGMRHISASEALGLLEEGAIILDVRPEYELGKLFDVNQIIYCPYPEIHEKLSQLPRDMLLIVADAVGLRSKEVAGLLISEGFNNITHLAGGIVDWERDGHPVTQDRSRILNGPCMCQLKPRNK